MREFTKLAEGSTTGDAELINGRIGVDGTVYPTIGEANRKQLAHISESIKNGYTLNGKLKQLNLVLGDSIINTSASNKYCHTRVTLHKNDVITTAKLSNIYFKVYKIKFTNGIVDYESKSDMGSNEYVSDEDFYAYIIFRKEPPIDITEEVMASIKVYRYRNDNMDYIDKIANKTGEIYFKPDFLYGNISAATGAYVFNGTRLCTLDEIIFKKGMKLALTSGYEFNMLGFNNGVSYGLIVNYVNEYIFKEDCTVKINVKRLDGLEINNSDFINVSNGFTLSYVYETALEKTYNFIDSVGGIANFQWKLGHYNSSNGSYNESVNRICTDKLNFAKVGTTFTIEDGYHFSLRLYDAAGNYKGYSKPSNVGIVPWVTTYTLREDMYYQINIRKIDDSNITDTALLGGKIKVKTDNIKIQEKFKACIEGNFNSYYTSINFADANPDYITAGQLDLLYYNLIQTYPNKISRALLGYASNVEGAQNTSYPIYEYTITPPLYNTVFDETYDSYSGQKLISPPKVLISSGVHGFEKASVYALYQFIKQMLDTCETNEEMAALHSNYIFKIIGCANPYGYTVRQSYNARNVNLNRNFTYSWSNQTTNAADKGISPASELETKIYCKWLNDNKDAALHIDYHTTLANLCTYINTQDIQIQKIFSSLARTLNRRWRTYNYNLEAQDKPFITYNYNANLTNEAFNVYGIKNTCILEFSPYDQGATDEKFTVNVIKIGVELLSNFLLSFLKNLK